MLFKNYLERKKGNRKKYEIPVISSKEKAKL